MINQAIKTTRAGIRRLQTWPIQPKFQWSLIKLRWKSCNCWRDQESLVETGDLGRNESSILYIDWGGVRHLSSAVEFLFCGLLSQDKWDTIVSEDPHCPPLQGYNLSTEEVYLFSLHDVKTQDYHSWVSGFGKFSCPLPRFRPHRKSCIALNVRCLNANRPKA